MKIASLADVKTRFSAYVRASEKEPVLVTRNGRPVAMLLAVDDNDELERLMMACSPRLREILSEARKRIQAGEGVSREEMWKRVLGEPAPRVRNRKRDTQ